MKNDNVFVFESTFIYHILNLYGTEEFKINIIPYYNWRHIITDCLYYIEINKNSRSKVNGKIIFVVQASSLIRFCGSNSLLNAIKSERQKFINIYLCGYIYTFFESKPYYIKGKVGGKFVVIHGLLLWNKSQVLIKDLVKFFKPHLALDKNLVFMNNTLKYQQID